MNLIRANIDFTYLILRIINMSRSYTIPHVVVTQIVEISPETGKDISPEATVCTAHSSARRLSLFVKTSDAFLNVQVIHDPTSRTFNTAIDIFDDDPNSPTLGKWLSQFLFNLPFMPTSVTLNQVGQLVVHE